MEKTIAPTERPVKPHTAMLGLGVYRPSRVVTNDEIAGSIDSSDEWIRTRSGIQERRFCSPDETLIGMSVSASAQALASANLAPQQVDCIIVATSTHQMMTPAAAPLVAAKLGLGGAAAFDVSAACAGFSTALGLASDMVRGGTARFVLVVGVEKLSDAMDSTDRTTAFIFADGAGAVVVGPSGTVGIGPTVWGSDAAYTDAITQTKEFVAYFDEVSRIGSAAARPVVRMNGPAVFRWAVQSLEKVCRDALDRADVSVADLDALIPHQANDRITDAMTRVLGVPDTCAIAHDIRLQGNTSAASIPLAMETLLRTEAVRPGGLALLVGFGAGLVYSSQVVRLPGKPR